MNKLEKTMASAAMAAALCGATVASAAVNCGDTITDSQKMMISLVCGAHDPAITIDGGSLDMNGRTISGCAGDGVALLGQGGELKNGTITGCGTGVLLGDDGRHKVVNVLSTGNSGHGFRVPPGSDKNTLVNAHAVGNGLGGFEIASSKNKLTSCSAVGNDAVGAYGFEQSFGEKNSYKDSVASRNDQFGFFFYGQGTSLKGCVSSENAAGGFGNEGSEGSGSSKLSACVAAGGDDGFLPGDGDKLSKCVAVGNSNVGYSFAVSDDVSLSKSSAVDIGDDCVSLAGSRNALKSLNLSNCGDDGIHTRVAGAGSTISGCTIAGSSDVGIHNTSHTDLVVSKNVVLRSATFDLDDDLASCGTNTWSKNVAATRSEACIE